MGRLARDGTDEPVSRDQILRRERGQGNIHFPCSADHELDWKFYPIASYSARYDDHIYSAEPNTWIHLLIMSSVELRLIFETTWNTSIHLETVVRTVQSQCTVKTFSRTKTVFVDYLEFKGKSEPSFKQKAERT